MSVKALTTAILFVITSFSSFFVPPALAASQEECAIWLCLPTGFPDGCGSAHSAMIDRIEDFKSPLPSFSSCAVDAESGSQMSHTYSYAALIGEHRVCTSYRYTETPAWAKHRAKQGRECVEWKTVPQHYRKDTRCRVDRDQRRTPAHCIGTYRYIDVYLDGQPTGETFYWR